MANKGAIGKLMIDWKHGLEQKWPTLHFGEVKVETFGEQHVFEIRVFLADLDPKAVRVELYADGNRRRCIGDAGDEASSPVAGATGGYVYSAPVPSSRPQKTIRRVS